MNKITLLLCTVITFCSHAMDHSTENPFANERVLKNALGGFITRYQNIVLTSHSKSAKYLKHIQRNGISYQESVEYLQKMQQASLAECAAITDFREKTKIKSSCTKEKSLRLPGLEETVDEYWDKLSKKDKKLLSKTLKKYISCSKKNS